MLTIPYAHARPNAPLLHPSPPVLAYSQCSCHIRARANAHALLVGGHPLLSVLFSLGEGGEHAHAPAL